METTQLRWIKDQEKEWLEIVRMVLLPRAEDYLAIKTIKPISCLAPATNYLWTFLEKYIKEHVMRNDM